MRKTFSIFFLLLISTFSFTFSQVVIKEKVNLNPSAKITTYTTPDYTPCGPLKVSTDYFNPWQVVWNGSTFALDPMQQLFNQQGRYYFNYGLSSNNIYNIEITKGQEYCHIIDATNGDTLGNTLSNVSGKDLIGTGQWSKNWCDLWETDSLPKYWINFDRDAPQGTEVVMSVKSNSEETAINYHTLVEIPLMQFTTSFAPTIKHYDSTLVDLIANPISCTGTCWGYLPSSIKYTVEIASGEQYGRLYNTKTGQSSNSFSGIETDGRDIYGIYFVADGVQPDSSLPGIVKVDFIPSDPDLGTQEATINVHYNTIKPGIVISMDKTNIDPGDTLQINLNYRNKDGSITDFPYWVKFEVGIIEGCEGGKLWAEDDTGAYFNNVSQPIKFIAADSIKGDSLSIKLRAAPVEGGIIAGRIAQADSVKRLGIVNKIVKADRKRNLNYPKSATVKPNKVNTVINKVIQSSSKDELVQSSVCFGGEFQNPKSEDTTLNVIDNKILLGETKYFGVKKNKKDASLNIEEIKTNYGEKPVFPSAGDGWTWVKDNSIWGSNPITVDIGKNYGKKMGVYWETDKPVWDGNNNKGNLSKGLIRLVGRYWTADSTYKVNLTAKQDKDSASIEIKVIKPGKLLKDGQSPTYSKSRDVFNKKYSVDSLCIYWGGLYGIPPQLLKGHIEKEAPAKDFTGYTGFAPAYRYEPFTTQFWNDVKNLIDNNNPFVVTKNAMGISGAAKVPTETEHYNVLLIHYPQSPKTVWEFIDENSQLTNPNNPSTFGYRYIGSPPDERKKGQMHSSSYSAINDNYQLKLRGADTLIMKKYKAKNIDNLTLKQQIEANDSARVQLVKFLKYEWKGNLDSIAAQTRIAASYGLLQNLYTTALDEGFKDTLTNNPEKLNELDGFKYNIYHYASLFNKNGFGLKKTNNFVSSYKYYNSKTNRLIFEAGPGFEEAFRTVVFNWNKSSGYNKKVFEYMKNFLPRK